MKKKHIVNPEKFLGVHKYHNTTDGYTLRTYNNGRYNITVVVGISCNLVYSVLLDNEFAMQQSSHHTSQIWS